MILNLVYVALGGAVGAALRYLVGIGVIRLVGQGLWQGFPLAIVTVNVVGSFLMGAFVVLAAQRGLTHLSPLIMTGLLGGFTTFSAFSLETVTLMERGAYGTATLYVGLSVAGAVGALMLGMVVTRGILA
ncbi:fluoride efflux transporter CrcB [Shimia marina]|uniref:Fluoride-specific ion channel FluC n=1 Tax=Shimia marina TaxID=321267 RepID=A0A0P1EL30_9RHOB|nr:fluoride efflux transporter CrcB [Shimia marina]CUH50933.1 camphor resistance protein CrcB [Shimia marina]SFE57240.1 CrcB protein [Shimia marina]